MARLLLASCLFVCALAHAKAPSKAELEKLQAQIKATEAKITRQQSQQSSLQNQLRQSEKSLGQLQANINKLQTRIGQNQQQLKQLEQQQKQLQKSKVQQEQKIVEQINASYRSGRQSKIKLLLNQEQPQKISRAMQYADYINQARIQSIAQYQATVEQLEDNQQAINLKSGKLLNDKNALVGQRKHLKAAIAKRNKALKHVKASIQGDRQKLQQMEQEQKDLQRLLKAVETTVQNIQLPSDSTPFRTRKGKLPSPVQAPIEHRYGHKRKGTEMRWEGIAFNGSKGQKITAVHHGRVVFADWFRGKGLLMIIDHGHSYMTLYAHNESLLREAGDWVSAGETIATLGNSGGLDHNELYFEIRKNGKPQNPKHWLAR